MTTKNDIILKIIKERGYKNLGEFCKKNNISYDKTYKRMYSIYGWDKEMLSKIGSALSVDLIKFVKLGK